MAEIDPADRVRGFQEFQCGYTLQDVIAEADRCLRCRRPLCVQACPAHNDIPGFVDAVARGQLAEAAKVLARTTPLPAICGRLCDHARQCEGACVVGRRGDPVAIGAIERYVGDVSSATDTRPARTARAATGSGGRIAVIGAGPAGLTAAGELVRRNHAVTVFEALPRAGGVLAWGIPTFRLPQPVLERHLDELVALGVAFQFGERLGSTFSVAELLEDGFAAVFLAIGADVPRRLRVPGKYLPGVYQAHDFLSRSKLSQLGDLPVDRRPVVGDRVVVVGAGNTAIDAAQTARRLGAEDVLVLYRRSREELPARREEVRSAEAEGVRFQFLVAPRSFCAGPDGRVRTVDCDVMRLGDPGSDGRRRPEPCPESAFSLRADTVVLALGFTPDGGALAHGAGVTLGPDGCVLVDPATGQTSHPKVWAGGDVATGPATVVGAMVWGLRVASAIHAATQSTPRRQ